MTFLVWGCSRAPGVPPTQPRGAQTHPREPISPQHGWSAAYSGNNITAVQPLMFCVNISINAAAVGLRPHNHYLCFSPSQKLHRKLHGGLCVEEFVSVCSRYQIFFGAPAESCCIIAALTRLHTVSSEAFQSGSSGLWAPLLLIPHTESQKHLHLGGQVQRLLLSRAAHRGELAFHWNSASRQFDPNEILKYEGE